MIAAGDPDSLQANMAPTMLDLKRELRLSNSLRSVGGLAAALMPVRIRLNHQQPIAFKLNAHDQKVNFWVQDRSHLIVIEEIFADHIYAEPSLTDPLLIVDLGANIGASTLYFKTRYPVADVIAVEPDPDTCTLLRRNVEPFGVTVHQAAIGASDQPVRFARAVESFASSTVIVDGGNVITVPGVRLDDLGDSRDIDLLKIDIEGAEFEVLANCDLSRVRNIVGEVHLGDSTVHDVSLFERLLPGFTVQYTDVLLNEFGPWTEQRNFVAFRQA